MPGPRRSSRAGAPSGPPAALAVGGGTDGLAGFHEAVRAWVRASFKEPTRVQAEGWPAIQRGESALLLAPTGSGKTLAAFLAAIDRLMFEPVPPVAARCRVLYLSPLRALAVDVERNLRAPLAGIMLRAEALGVIASTRRRWPCAPATRRAASGRDFSGPPPTSW